MTGVAVIGWEASRTEWLAARRQGMGGSDISAVLGFSPYRTPWNVWAEKTDTKTWDDEGSAAADLGVELEPWLRDQAERVVGSPASETEYRTYAHPEHPWRMCSPDGVFADGRLLECKTAGLASGFGTPRGWSDDSVPLGYEFQCRWSLHVMDAPAAELVALVAGLGLIHRTVTRDMAVEADMVAQVSDWWRQYVVADTEPPLGGPDTNLMRQLYPRTETELVDLTGTEAIDHWNAYQDAAERERAAQAAKATAAANLARLMGTAGRAEVDGHTVAAYSDRKGAVDWRRLVDDFAAETGHTAPNPDDYRKPASRALRVKDLT